MVRRCSSNSRSAIGTFVSYQRSSPVLSPGDQKDCRAPGVEGVQHTQWVAAGLGAQFAHLGKPGRLHLGAEGKSEIGPAFHEQINPSVDFPLLCFSQGVPPLLELVSEFDFPSHNPNIA